MVNFSAQRDVTLSIYLLNQNEDISLEKKKELLVKAEIYKFALSILFWILGGDPFEDMSNLPVLTETQQLSERVKENSLAFSKVVDSRFEDDFSDLSLKGVNIRELYMVTNVAIIWLMSLDLTFQSLLSDLGLTLSPEVENFFKKALSFDLNERPTDFSGLLGVTDTGKVPRGKPRRSGDGSSGQNSISSQRKTVQKKKKKR